MVFFRALCLLALLVVVQNAIIEHFSAEDKPTIPLIALVEPVKRKDSQLQMKVVEFSWNNCDKPSSVINVTSLTVSPSPIPSPGNVTVMLNSTVTGTIPTPLEIDTKLEVKKIFWITVPCENNIGTCEYRDVCKSFPKSVTCPPKKGPFNITHSFPVPSSVPSGKFRYTANFVNESNKDFLACLQILFEVSQD